MIKGGWYCCDDCGRKLLAVRKQPGVQGVHIRCRRRTGHIYGRLHLVGIDLQEGQDMGALQEFIEQAHISINRGECQTYNICKYCTEQETLFKSSATPCADAFSRMFHDAHKKQIFSKG